MRFTLAVLNLAVGLGYVGIGTLASIDLVRGWRRWGYSHFAAGFIGIALTCGPHHLAHAFHLTFEGRPGGALDVVSVVVGLPAAAIFVMLRAEAFRGGRGDRFVDNTPLWLMALPTLAAIYLTAMIAAAIASGSGRLVFSSQLAANIALLVIYATIGSFLLRTQVKNRGAMGGWSMSGMSLMAVFFTCAVMHGVYALYSITGRYRYDVHTFVIDWVAVPFGIYFLWCVRGLYQGSISDWNQDPETTLPLLPGVLAEFDPESSRWPVPAATP